MNAIGLWRKCSTCKKDIALGSSYYECSVSTCTGQRTGYVFCSVNCWEVHLPGARHRDAGAVEKRAPATAAPPGAAGVESRPAGEANAAGPRRILVASPSPSASAAASATGRKTSPMSQEVLVVVSKMKQYIRDISEMNTAEEVNRVLSDLIRTECEKAITRARADGRKTVMARDFEEK